MLPPSDSLHHQNLKIAEFISSIQATQAPPPAYSSTRPATAAIDQDQSAEDDDDYDYDCPSTPPAPITINIDASLKVEGHANTIVLSTVASLPAAPSTPSKLPLAAEPRTVPSPTPETGRVQRLTGMVLNALRDAGLLDCAPDAHGEMLSRPVEIHVNAGIVLKGNRNTVCSGLPKSIKPAAAVVGSVANGETNVKGVERGGVESGSKRRACSVNVLPQDCTSLRHVKLMLLPGASRDIVSQESSLLLRAWRATARVNWQCSASLVIGHCLAIWLILPVARRDLTAANSAGYVEALPN